MQTRSLDEFNAEAAHFAAGLKKGSSATVIALSGELGAGKTTFTQQVAKYFGVEETVSSPTFVIEKVYTLEGREFARLIHIDAYRLKSEHELEVLGWSELLADRGNLILIEWPEKVSALIPESAHRISLQYRDEETREITYGN